MLWNLSYSGQISRGQEGLVCEIVKSIEHQVQMYPSLHKVRNGRNKIALVCYPQLSTWAISLPDSSVFLYPEYQPERDPIPAGKHIDKRMCIHSQSKSQVNLVLQSYAMQIQCTHLLPSLLSTNEPIGAPRVGMRSARTPSPNQHALVVGAEEGWNVDGRVSSTVESPLRPGALLVIAC